MAKTDPRLKQLKAAKAAADERKGWAWEHAAEVYRERDLLACTVARLCLELERLGQPDYHAHVMAARGDRSALCVHTPAGQLAWMFPTRSTGTQQANSGTFQTCLTDLPATANDWDKAKTVDRFARLEELAKTPKRGA